MSLRQREWAIYIRPYYTRGAVRIDYKGAPKASDTDTLAPSPRGYSVTLKGDAEASKTADTGSWVMWYKTTSFKKLRDKYKELLQMTSADNTRVAEIVNVNTLITPIS